MVKEDSLPCDLLRVDIPFVFDEKIMQGLLHCAGNSRPYLRCLALLEQARPLLAPAFAVRRFSAGDLTDEGIRIGGVSFCGKVLADKLKQAENIYAYFATCGRDIARLIQKTANYLDRYLLDQLAYMAYLQAMDQLAIQAESVFGVKRLTRLCAGSVVDWNVDEIKKIFILLDGLYQVLGAEVWDSGLIYPLKSTAGFFYDTDMAFESCTICPMLACETRRAPFDQTRWVQMTNS